MTKTEIIPGKLYAFGDKFRAELGPQLIELECSDENLSDDVTAAHYQKGARDALGRRIRPDELIADPSIDTTVLEGMVALDKHNGVKQLKAGENMVCVDWRCKHKPMVWKVYELQTFKEANGKGQLIDVEKFIKIDEKQTLEEAEAVIGGVQ